MHDSRFDLTYRVRRQKQSITCSIKAHPGVVAIKCVEKGCTKSTLELQRSTTGGSSIMLRVPWRMIVILTGLVLGGGADFPVVAQTPNVPAPNRFLSAEKYATAHFDPARTGVFLSPVPAGTFTVDLHQFPRIAGGPVNFLQLSSTSPEYMWATSTGGVHFVDISKEGWRAVASLNAPKAAPLKKFEDVLSRRFATIKDVEHAVTQDLEVDDSRLFTNVHTCVDDENTLYATVSTGVVNAYGLADPSDPTAGIKLLRSLDLSDVLQDVGARSASPILKKYGAVVTAMTLTHDGMVAIGTSRSVIVTSRDFKGPLHTFEFDPNEFISNSIAIDEEGGIYVVGEKAMYKIFWTGSELSSDELDGAWASEYDKGRELPGVKFGSGSGSSPVLMGFGHDPDKLVVITDGADHMKLVAFWRDLIPANFKQLQNTKSRRIAGQIQITCGLPAETEFVQSGQSAVVGGYGAFVVNDFRLKESTDKFVDVLAAGPIFDLPAGCERCEWDPKTRTWHSLWTRPDAVVGSMIPAMSSPSKMALISGYTKQDGWELTGLDWETGKTVHRSVFGHGNLGNGAFAHIQFFINGDLLFNSVGGPTRVRYEKP